MAKLAALGIRAHSGWAAVIIVAGDLAAPQVVARERISVVDSRARGATQPYHFAKTLSIVGAETHLAACAGTARRLAAGRLATLRDGARQSGFRLVGCAILTASGRPIPPLADVLRSHAMIHTAEGEFFRNAFGDACQDMHLPVERFRERDLLDLASTELRQAPTRIKSRVSRIGRTIGPPWTQDQKNATLAALLLLHHRAS